MPRTKPFRGLADPIMAHSVRRARIDTHRRSLDPVLALRELVGRSDRSAAEGSHPDDTPGRACCLEHDQDVLLTVLRDDVTALGGELDIKAVFPDCPVSLVPTQP